MASLLTAPLYSLWTEFARGVAASARAMPDGMALGLCFLAVFAIAYLALRLATTAGDRRGLHDVARVRLGISDEYPLSMRRASIGGARFERKRIPSVAR